MKKFIRVLSPITIAVISALDTAVIGYGVFSIKKLQQTVDVWTILFAIIEVIALVIAFFVSKEVVSNGVRFDEEGVEFTGLDENNCFKYSEIVKVETNKDTKASLKKNFVDRYSHVILHLNDESVVTIDLGLTTVKTLKKIEKEINDRI